MNQKARKRNDFVKHLGAYFHKKLTWSVHVYKLSLRLVNLSAMLHQVRD